MPTDKERETVRAMAAYGVDQRDIAKVIHIAEKTLRKYFREELDNARILADAKVRETGHRLATSGKCYPMTIFWLKARCGFCETEQVNGKQVIEIRGGLPDDEKPSSSRRRSKRGKYVVPYEQRNAGGEEED